MLVYPVANHQKTSFKAIKLSELEQKLVEDIEIPLTTVLAKMEHIGVAVDTEYLKELSDYMTEKLAEVSEQEAKKKAADFLEVDENSIYFLSKTDSNLPTYTFYNADTTISVTQKGGFISYILKSKMAGESVLTPENAIKKAVEYLKKHGYENIKESYYSTNDGICTMNFSYYQGGITYYTDLIKVSVALDDGEITAFDATGFLMNHKKRDIPENIKYTLKSGKSLIKDGLTVISSKKAFIPTEWETENFTYEYHCRDENGEEVLIYIDPVTGEEKEILILLYSDGGMLTK